MPNPSSRPMQTFELMASERSAEAQGLMTLRYSPRERAD